MIRLAQSVSGDLRFGAAFFAVGFFTVDFLEAAFLDDAFFAMPFFAGAFLDAFREAAFFTLPFFFAAIRLSSYRVKSNCFVYLMTSCRASGPESSPVVANEP